MTKTLNQIIIFFLQQNQNIFLEKKHNPPLQVKWSVPKAIFQLYCCGKFHWWRENVVPEENKQPGNQTHSFQVVISTDCIGIGRWKSTYSMIGHIADH